MTDSSRNHDGTDANGTSTGDTRGPGLSEEDHERIKQFLETPAYDRDPEQLAAERPD